MKIHIGFIKEGTILHFPNSVYDYMKVCDRNGIGGVVNLSTGLYISTSDLEKEGLSSFLVLFSLFTILFYSIIIQIR